MLKQLAHLTIDADGRYATDAELKFITKYLESVEDRIEIYEQIRDSEDNLVAQVKSSKTMLANEGHNFSYLTEEQKEVCTRDIKTVIRCSAAAILLDEPDRLKEALLLWYFTIARAIGFIDHCQIAYQILEKTIQQKVTPEQAKLAAPILRLNYTILSP
jgi:Phycobilisome protein